MDYKSTFFLSFIEMPYLLFLKLTVEFGPALTVHWTPQRYAPGHLAASASHSRPSPLHTLLHGVGPQEIFGEWMKLDLFFSHQTGFFVLFNVCLCLGPWETKNRKQWHPQAQRRNREVILRLSNNRKHAAMAGVLQKVSGILPLFFKNRSSAAMFPGAVVVCSGRNKAFFASDALRERISCWI